MSGFRNLFCENYKQKIPSLSLGDFVLIAFIKKSYFTSSKITISKNQLVTNLWYKYGIENETLHIVFCRNFHLKIRELIFSF